MQGWEQRINLEESYKPKVTNASYNRRKPVQTRNALNSYGNAPQQRINQETKSKVQGYRMGFRGGMKQIW